MLVPLFGLSLLVQSSLAQTRTPPSDCPDEFGRPPRYEKCLIDDLFANYTKEERPTDNHTETVVVKFKLDLQQIIDLDEKSQTLKTNMWLNFEWNDANLDWDPALYGGVVEFRARPELVWTPDVMLEQSASEPFDPTYKTNVIVSSDGTCVYIPPGIFQTTCKIDIVWFPFDEQECDFTFVSWTYTNNQLNLTNVTDRAITETFMESMV